MCTLCCRNYRLVCHCITPCTTIFASNAISQGACPHDIWPRAVYSPAWQHPEIFPSSGALSIEIIQLPDMFRISHTDFVVPPVSVIQAQDEFYFCELGSAGQEGDSSPNHTRRHAAPFQRIEARKTSVQVHTPASLIFARACVLPLRKQAVAAGGASPPTLARWRKTTHLGKHLTSSLWCKARAPLRPAVNSVYSNTQVCV